MRDVKIPKAGKYSESQKAMRTSFGGRCAAYGTRENQPDPRYGGGPVVLQPGHKDPAKAGDERANIVPQRQFRNRGYKDDFTFDDRGRVRAIAGIGPARRATRDARRRVYERLKRRFPNAAK